MAKLTKLRNCTLEGWIRHLSLKLTGKAVWISGRCVMCGSCCRSVSLEAGGRWLRSEKHFRRMVEEYPEYGRFSIVGRDQTGLLLFSCSWYTDQGICRDHKQRLPICREFPHISLYFAGGRLPRACGFRFVTGIPFSSHLKERLDEENG